MLIEIWKNGLYSEVNCYCSDFGIGLFNMLVVIVINLLKQDDHSRWLVLVGNFLV